MDVLYIIILSLTSITEIFILCKCIGSRQLSQMSMFDYVTGITIGNIAAEMATSIDNNIIYPFTAMIVYALASIFLSWICSKSIVLRRILSGKPLILVDHGTIYETNFKKAKIDLNEFLTQCRVSGYFDLSQLETVILEENGRISFLPKSDHRPLTPNDIQLSPSRDHLAANLIIDGKLMPENLETSGKDLRWLKSKLKAQGVTHIEDIFLATYDLKETVTVYPYSHSDAPPDLFS